MSLQLYNIYLKSNAYVTALGNFDPAARPEIQIFDLQNRRMYLRVYEHWFQLRTTETFNLTLPCQDLHGFSTLEYERTGARIWSFILFAALIRFSIMEFIIIYSVSPLMLKLPGVTIVEKKKKNKTTHKNAEKQRTHLLYKKGTSSKSDWMTNELFLGNWKKNMLFFSASRKHYFRIWMN